MGMKQYTYCGPMVFVKPIVKIHTRICRTHGEKEGYIAMFAEKI